MDNGTSLSADKVDALNALRAKRGEVLALLDKAFGDPIKVPYGLHNAIKATFQQALGHVAALDD